MKISKPSQVARDNDLAVGPALLRAVLFLSLSFFLLTPCFPVRAAEKAAGPALRPQVGTYDELLAAIRKTRQASRARIEQEKVREAWETGRLIDEYILRHKKRAEYGARVIERLAKDLGSSPTELKYMLKFARTYPIRPTSGELTWSDYRELLSLNDPLVREEVSRKAAREHWDVQRIRREVQRINQLARTGVEPSQRLIAKPGIPHTYRVVRGTEENERVIDLGFSNYYTPAGKLPFQEKDILQVVDGEYKKLDNAIKGDLYTYETKVLEVIDGDTIKAVVDLGFGFRTAQTLRLRGIDAPEIATADGMEAKKALEKMLNVPHQHPATLRHKALADRRVFSDQPVLIKTVKSDKYDRYLADVFYPSPQKAGRRNPPGSMADVSYVYVNQKLVDEGYAVIVEE